MSQVEIADSILSALLTGGFILFFVESQHIEQNINDKLRSIMFPYYSRLTLFLQITFMLQSRYEFLLRDKTQLGKLIKELARLGGVTFSSGLDIPYKSSRFLTGLNDKTNDLWDKYSNEYDNFNFDLSGNLIYNQTDIYGETFKISPEFSKFPFDKFL